MKKGGITGSLYSLLEWVSRLAYINILWLIFSMLGLFVFTFFPATAAMFTVVKKWLMGNTDIPVFKTFWREFRAEFWRSHLIGCILIFSAVILYVDFQFFSSLEGIYFYILAGVTLSISFLYLVVLIFIFPALAYYKLTFWGYFKQSLVIGLYSPFAFISILFSAFIIYILIMSVPALAFFFAGSTFAYIITWFTFKTLKRAEKVMQDHERESINTESVNRTEVL